VAFSISSTSCLSSEVVSFATSMIPTTSSGLPSPVLLAAFCASRTRSSRSIKSSRSSSTTERYNEPASNEFEREARSAAALAASPSFANRLDFPQRIEHADIVVDGDDPDDAEASAVARQELVALGPVRNDRLELAQFIPLGE
jgi:hypothetical protein